MPVDYARLIEAVIPIARATGNILLSYWGQIDRLNVQKKQDNTLLTQADLAANELLHQQLSQLTPGIPILSEEDDWPEFSERSQWSSYWLLDPLDGTRGFVDKSEQFATNIALIDGHQAVMGFIYIPTQDCCYYAAQDLGAFRLDRSGECSRLTCEAMDEQNIRVLLGGFHRSKRMRRVFESVSDYQVSHLNSAWKFGHIAEGRADIYPRLGPTGEWDTAAGQCILDEAGGAIVDFNGNPLQYNARDSLINPKFLAIGDPRQIGYMLAMIQDRT